MSGLEYAALQGKLDPPLPLPEDILTRQLSGAVREAVARLCERRIESLERETLHLYRAGDLSYTNAIGFIARLDELYKLRSLARHEAQRPQQVSAEHA